MVTKTPTAIIAGRVEAARRRANVTPHALAITAGIPRTTLIRKLDGHTDFTIPELIRISEHLGAKCSDLLRGVAS